MTVHKYLEINKVYHIISVIDLNNVLKNGIRYDDKKTYKSKYYEFHNYIDEYKNKNIPNWVIRKKAIFGSLYFSKEHMFHSHTALLGIKIDPNKCWIANENLANQIYEPFILHKIDEYSGAKNYLENEGSKLLYKYWETSCSFKENLKLRLDKNDGYDAEVLIFHDIKPSDIEVLYIISDHRMMTKEEWKKHFCNDKGNRRKEKGY
ncbi:hypothetical protein [Paramaledivibacter caminithermalis]|jgi:hypothetical protein|uniref:DarT domain-containing protein n=1 Tax=Paramaledivibacter caminithermalis (strain DSM 15212 / CIP 107654 / DViRD3) TaxID=1121301 RepID=A0A1M6NUA7_PARC5|nr:hypothetical protein [Paramaledivibacter caminithermalis]SHJ99261.1 hypothetical protein SAMN02745912_01873 [Paramaledivibacter caminithermalis DSM 15212]